MSDRLPTPPSPSDEELRARFFPHGPTDVFLTHSALLSERFFELAKTLRDWLPPGREASIAQSHLEDAKTYAVKAAARAYGIPPSAPGEPVAVPRGDAG